jgi:hypothetical protein
MIPSEQNNAVADFCNTGAQAWWSISTQKAPAEEVAGAFC